MNTELAAKRLGLIHELVPQAARYFALINPTSPLAGPFISDLQTGAAALGVYIPCTELAAWARFLRL
jgi:putative ABC transport system substrate-binding protein